MKNTALSHFLYIALSVSLCVPTVKDVMGQHPGGVPTPVLWETDFGANHDSLIGYALFNFHPYRYFSISADSFLAPIQALKKLSYFMVYSSVNDSEISRINTGNNEVLLTDTAMLSHVSLPYPSTFERPKFVSFIESFPYQRSRLTMTPAFRVGSDPEAYEVFEGGLAEVILYDRYLDRSQRQKVESYLSLKYGISLPDSSDYVRSDGGLVWIAEDHPVYRYRLTGIGRDDGTLLYQKQSHNLYSDIDLTIGLNAIAQTNDSNTSTLSDFSYILWADDSASGAFLPMDTMSSLPTKLERTWEIFVNHTELRSIPLEVRLDTTGLEYLDSTLSLWLVRLANPAWSFDHQDADFIPMQSGPDGSYTCELMLDDDSSGSDLFSFMQGPTQSAMIVADTIQCGLQYGRIHVQLEGFASGRKEVILLPSASAKRITRHTDQNKLEFDRLVPGSYEVRVPMRPFGVYRQIVSVEQEVCVVADTLRANDLIFPNPVSTSYDFTVVLPDWDESDLTISIVNADGKPIRQDKVSRDISPLYQARIAEPGNYIILVASKDKSQAYKLVVQK